MAFPPLSTATIIPALGGLLLLRLIYLVVYRVFFHPLAKVPGNKIAAATYLYDFYYDAICQGKFVFQLDDFHRQYGSVVRINPEEVHISDPKFFNEFYNSADKLYKDTRYYRFVGTSDAAFGTASFGLHRQRRKAFNRFFSTSALNELEAQIQKNVLRLCSRLEEHRGTDMPVILSSAFRSLGTDVISQYALPKGFELLSSRDFGEDYNNTNRKLSGIAAYNRHFPFILPMMMSMPTWLIKLTASPGMLQMIDFQAHNQAQSQSIVSSDKKSDESVLHGIYNSDLPAREKTANRIYQEALTLVGAGSETTGSALEHTFYHILADPAIKSRLCAELAAATDSGGDLLSKDTLQSLPYLEACVKEGLRIGNEVSGRLPRYDPVNPITYKSYTFPPGTIISMSVRDMHLSPTVHLEPRKYNPDRFLDPSMRKQTEQYFAPFGKGPRSCVGRELAMLEMTMCLANLLSKFEFELYETTARDIEMDHDFFSPFRRDDSKGLQALIR